MSRERKKGGSISFLRSSFFFRAFRFNLESGKGTHTNISSGKVSSHNGVIEDNNAKVGKRVIVVVASRWKGR